MAVVAIANLCEDMLNLPRVAAAGAMEILVGARGEGMIADAHPLVAREAVRAVSNLASNPRLAQGARAWRYAFAYAGTCVSEYPRLAADAALRGAVPCIAGLLSSPDVLCRRIAARALANLFVAPEATAAAVGPADAVAAEAAAKEAAISVDPVAICSAAAAAASAMNGAPVPAHACADCAVAHTRAAHAHQRPMDTAGAWPLP